MSVVGSDERKIFCADSIALEGMVCCHSKNSIGIIGFIISFITVGITL